MTLEDRSVEPEPVACAADGFAFDEDGTKRRTTPCLCLPGAVSGPDAMTGWLECATCGTRQAPGKAWCGFCGSRWVTAS
jgi:hypothetical protein